MKLSLAAKILIASYMNLKFTYAQDSSIEDYYKDGCKNDVAFTSSFESEDGSECDKCVLCDGTIPSNFFDPRVPNNCAECTSETNTCDAFSITTTFQSPWNMKFNILRSSDKDKNYDPKQVIIKGSNDNKLWEDVHVTEVGSEIFKSRNELKKVVLNNDKTYKAYKITFKMKKTLKIYTGTYGIIESYTRQCAAALHNAISKNNLLTHDTMAPTSNPTPDPTANPTTAPTDAPTSNPTAVTKSPVDFQFTTIAELRAAVNLWPSDKSAAMQKYGEINNWDVSRVMTMHQLFRNKHTFNEDLSQWNVSQVTNMTEMFYAAKVFNSDISQWDVANVTNMNAMFESAHKFNVNLSDWNVKKVTNFSYMFSAAYVFDQKLCWDLSKISDSYKGGMFINTKGGSADPNC